MKFLTVIIVTVVFFLIEGASAGKKTKNKRQTLKVHDDVEEKERLLAERQAKIEKEQEILATHLKRLEDERRAQDKTLTKKEDGGGAASSSAIAAIGGVTTNDGGRFDPNTADPNSREYKDYVELMTRCPSCPDSSSMEYALQRFWQGDLFESYACACRVLMNQPADKMAQSLRHAVTESRFSVVNLPVTYSAPAVDAPTYLSSWEVVGPFPSGKLELDADPLFATPVNSSVLVSPSQPSEVATLYSSLREPLRCMHVTGGMCPWDTRHISLSATFDIDEDDEVEMEMNGETAPNPTLPRQELLSDPNQRDAEPNPNSAPLLTNKLKRKRRRSLHPPTPTSDVALTLLTLPRAEHFYSELVAGGRVGWHKFKTGKKREESEVPHVLVDWANVDWGTIVQDLGRMEAVEFQAWARTTTYVRHPGQYVVSCRGVHTALVRNDNVTQVVAGDVYGGGMQASQSVVSSILHLQPGPVGVVVPLRGAGRVKFTCRIKYVHVITEQWDGGSVADEEVQQTVDVLEGVVDRVRSGSVSEKHANKPKPRPSSNGAKRQAQFLVKKDNVLLPDLIRGAFLADAAVLLHHGHMTWGVHGSGAADWPKGDRFYAPNLETSKNLAQHPLSLRFSLYVPDLLANHHHYRAMASRQRHEEEGSEERLEERPSGYRSGQSLSDGMLFGTLGVEPVDEASFHRTGGSAGGGVRRHYTVESGRVTLAPGQTVRVPLEIVMQGTEGQLPYIPCRKAAISIEVTSDIGEQQIVPLNFECRNANGSVVLNFLDGGGSVAQAAVIMPLSSPRTAITHLGVLYSDPDDPDAATPTGAGVRKMQCLSQEKYTKLVSADATGRLFPRTPGRLDREGNPACHLRPYPALLSLHGTGVTPRSHADAFKEVPRKVSGRPDSQGWDTYRFGVEGFWVVAPTKHGAHNWEYVGEEAASHALHAISALVKRHPKLPQLDADAVAVSGHSMGGHGALVWATHHPHSTVCLSVNAGWLSKEAYGHSNSYMALDIQTAVGGDAAVNRVMEAALYDQRPELLVNNLGPSVPVHVRVGSEDRTTPAWHSRRLARQLAGQGINVTLEEVAGHGHWWWDTHVSNDGGVLNDEVLQRFYSQCLARALVMQRSGPGGAPSGPHGGISRDGSHDKDSGVDDVPSRCRDGVRLVAYSPQSHHGLCGLRLQQQHHTMQRSTVSLACVEGSAYPDGRLPLLHSGAYAAATTADGGIDKGTEEQEYESEWSSSSSSFSSESGSERSTNAPAYYALGGRRCFMDTSNVRRLSVSIPGKHAGHNPFDQYVFGGTEIMELVVDGTVLSLPQAEAGKHVTLLDICWDGVGRRRLPLLCTAPLDLLSHRGPSSYGPLRALYSRPLIIVYGVPNDHSMRLMLRTLAMYLANSNEIAHHTAVTVVSDADYLQQVEDSSVTWDDVDEAEPPHVLFVGGSRENRVTRRLLLDATNAVESPSGSASGSGSQSGSSRQLSTRVRFPLNATSGCFSVHGHTYTHPDAAAISLLPITSDGSPGLAAVMVGNSLEAYQHLLRLAWPTVPPMTRGPLVQLPDFVVVDGSVWRLGTAGLLAGGYYTADWEVDTELSFFR